jgi:ribosomal protein L7/L12
MDRVLFASVIKDLNTVSELSYNHTENPTVLAATQKLQTALLTVALGMVKPPRKVSKKKNPDGLFQDEINLLRDENGKKIPAIKKIRERTGLGLKEAKDMAERWMSINLGFTNWPYIPPVNLEQSSCQSTDSNW